MRWAWSKRRRKLSERWRPSPKRAFQRKRASITQTISFRLALSFLTIIPAGIRGKVDETAFGRSVKYFPLVGLIIGAMLAALYGVTASRVEGAAAEFIVVLALVALTRALHLDAVADTFDGIYGGRDVEHALAIMKDSRVGSFGVVSIVAVMGLKTFLLASIPGDIKVASIIVFPVIGRWAAAYAMTTQPAARNQGLGALFVGGAGRVELLWASVITVVAAGFALMFLALPVVAAGAVFAMLYAVFIKRKIGGMTGDTIGALIELTEVGVLLLLAAL